MRCITWNSVIQPEPIKRPLYMCRYFSLISTKIGVSQFELNKATWTVLSQGFSEFISAWYFGLANLYLRMVIIKSSESIICGVGNDKTINDRRPYHLPIWWPRGKKSLLRELTRTFKTTLLGRGSVKRVLVLRIYLKAHLKSSMATGRFTLSDIFSSANVNSCLSSSSFARWSSRLKLICGANSSVAVSVSHWQRDNSDFSSSLQGLTQVS